VTRGILVYYPDAGEARAYADLIRLPSRAFRVHVASTPEEAAGPGADAEIFYCWGTPRALRAPSGSAGSSAWAPASSACSCPSCREASA
jgi:hypothetical protein